MYPGLIAINGFRNCEVAVKTLPSFADDIAKVDFMNVIIGFSVFFTPKNFQEINFMKSLNYDAHITSMLGYAEDPKGPLLLIELCVQGDLLTLIRRKKEEIIDVKIDF